MKKLPIGISDFKELITNNYIYVDKTKYIYELLSSS
ncbi:MAG: AAA family ATPase, partial [bacterium]|nr:AAA family ATPase [bacterium]